VRLTTAPPSMSQMSRQCGIFSISKSYTAPRPVTGTVALHHEGAPGAWRYISHHSWPRHKLEASNKRHYLLVLTENEAGWVTLSVGTLWRTEQIRSPCRESKSRHPGRSPSLYLLSYPESSHTIIRRYVISDTDNVLFGPLYGAT
jgi:hypothetical protein